ncbi:MAG: xanthine dehydrogenase family protein subunit M [Paracoccaceae bacterium]
MKYIKTESIHQASELLVQEKGISRILAGGTDVLVQNRLGLVEPDLVVNIKFLEGMRTIEEEDSGFRIGAAVCGSELGERADVRALWPGVVEGLELIGSTQIQGRATLVGNLCNASPSADGVPAMVTAQATVRVFGPEGFRDCSVLDIPVSPGRTSLKKGEFVTSIFLPSRPECAADAYLRFTPRTEMDIAVSAAAVSISLDKDGTINDAHVALGAVAPTVLNVPSAAAVLIGTKLDLSTLDKLATAASAACMPIDDKRGTAAFRIKTAGVLAQRSAKIAYKRAQDKI